MGFRPRVDYYFDVYLQERAKVSVSKYIKALDAYNTSVREDPVMGEETFFLWC